MTRTKALLVVLVFLVVSTAYADWQVFELGGRVGKYQKSNTEALCSFRGDLQSRVTSGDKFLKTHPNGIPGIPASTIKVSLALEQHTLTSLSPLRCPGSAAPKRHRR